MAKDESKKEAQAGKSDAKTDNQVRIIWDDTNMRSVYANVSNVTAGQEEVVLLFGMNQSWHAGQTDVKVQLTDRIVLSPFAAKRLSTLLNNVLTNYEKQYGKLELAVQRPENSPLQ